MGSVLVLYTDQALVNESNGSDCLCLVPKRLRGVLLFSVHTEDYLGLTPWQL